MTISTSLGTKADTGLKHQNQVIRTSFAMPIFLNDEAEGVLFR